MFNAVLSFLQDPSRLLVLTREALEDRLYELDAQFRRDMASLTDRYDDAQTAIQSSLLRLRRQR